DLTAERERDAGADVLLQTQVQTLLVRERARHDAAVVFREHRREVSRALSTAADAAVRLTRRRRLAVELLLEVVARTIRAAICRPLLSRVATEDGLCVL